VADAIPDFFTIPEAARVLRVGRTAAYLLAKRHLADGGRDGLPVVRIGRLLRVPRAELEKLVGGPITWPLPGPDGPTAAPVVHTRTRTPAPRRGNARRQNAAQLPLLESD
jgi:Helix-turn-helix domain